MKQRCYNPQHTYFAMYGGRGITIAEAWLTSFQTFLSDMGERPLGHTLERIDNNGPYCKENCKWVTRRAQAQNRRNNRPLTHNGETLVISEWARRLGFSKQTIRDRIAAGWSTEKALTEPVRKTKVNHG